MESDRSPKLPELDTANYAPWYLALETYATTIKATTHLETNPPIPTDPALYEEHITKRSKLLSAVLSSVPTTILGLILVPNERPSPYDLVTKVIAHVNQSTKEDHKYLKMEAESITFTSDTTIDSYIKSHIDIRQKMIAAQYPSITEEETTVDFIIAGLRKNASLIPVLGPLLVHKPTTIKQFTRCFKDLHTLYQPVHGPTPPAQLPPRFTGDSIGNYNYTYNQRGRGFYRRPYRQWGRRPPPPRRLAPGQVPCQFHTSLGIPSLHTDAQCQDRRHPKYHDQKPNAFLAHAQTIQQHPETYHMFPHQQFPPTQIPGTQPPIDMAHEADTDPSGTFLLDSGAQPTHITVPTPSMQRVTKQTLTHTVTNEQRPSTHHGIITLLPTHSNTSIKTYAVANRHVKHNLLSVHDLATRYGLVAFTPTTGYIINTHTTPSTIVAKAIWDTSQYRLKGKLLPNNIACTARTTGYKPGPRSNSKSINSPPAPSRNTTTHPMRQRTRLEQAPPITNNQLSPTTTRILQNLPTPNHSRKISNKETSLHNWHVKLNHAHPKKLSLTARKRLIPVMPTTLAPDIPLTCSSCDHAKLYPAPHKPTTHNYQPGAYVSSDTCGPIKPTSTHGSNHMLLIICAASRYVLAHFIKDRRDIPQYIDKSLHHIKQRMHHPLTDFRSDNAKEYLSDTMKTIYSKHDVHHHLRTPHQPQENAIAERLNRTIMNSVRALLATAKLDDRYWEDAARDTIYKYNLMHHSAIGTSPHHMWYDKKPHLQRLFTFGETGTIPVYSPKKKLEPRADAARYMYATTLTHVVVLNLRTNQYQTIRAADFHPYNKETDPSATTNAAFKANSKRNLQIPRKIQIDTPPPATLIQARLYPDASEWQKSHDEELRNIDQYNSITWQPQDFIPPRETIIPLMMVYRYKRSADGNILQRKARCNLRGDLMKPGVHFNPKHITTYTADRTTQRMILALHAAHRLPLEHFDIKSAYLHERYQHDRPVYVKQMPQFDGTFRHHSQYGKLEGNLYGSPPAAYYYNHGLKKFLVSIGFVPSEHDPCLYVRRTRSGFALVSTTIDDFLVLASQQSEINQLYQQLLTKYKIKRLGPPTRFLNWTITRHTNGAVHLSQPDAIDSILQQTNMTQCNPSATPYSHLTHLDQQTDTEPLSTQDAHSYRHILGEIRYVTDSTRPDLMYATNRLAQHMSQPQQHHQQALKTLLRYLKGTRTHGLQFNPLPRSDSKAQPQLETYSDADFANAKQRQSVTGNVHCLNGTPVSWLSRKQNVVALSTTEAEYISATQATQHTKWLMNLLEYATSRTAGPTTHYIDNRSTILIAQNQAPTKRRKYIDIRHHYLQHNIAQNAIALERIPTENMLADIFTKPLHRKRFKELREQLQVKPQPEPRSDAATGDCQTSS